MSIKKVLNEFGGKNFSFFKNKLSESIIEKISPIGEEIEKLVQDENHLKSVLVNGSNKANSIAEKNIKEVYDLVGLTKFA